MMDRDKIIKGLEKMLEESKYNDSVQYNPWADTETLEAAIALLKKSFTPDEVYHTVVEHGQHDKRFRLGDAINYSFHEVVDILRIELMCKAGDM